VLFSYGEYKALLNRLTMNSSKHKVKSQDIIELLVKHARPEILKEFREDSCIATTAIVLDILTHYGILAEPLAVRTLIFNKPFADRIENGANWPKGDEIHRWCEEDGSYSVGIGVGTQQPGKWAGHLVVLVEKQFLLDLSIDQAARPKYNMVLEPICVEIDESFLTGKPRVIRHNQCVIRIELLRENSKGYITSPDWTFANRRRKIVTNILKKIGDS
jgi:hypothetical protein